jgi:hypothetical protein
MPPNMERYSLVLLEHEARALAEQDPVKAGRLEVEALSPTPDPTGR